MRRAVVIASCVAALVGCKQRSEGLPAATEWSGSAVDEPPPVLPTTSMGKSGARNPHAGMDGDDPHAGLNIGGSDPHAGLDMSGGGMDVAKMGLAAPDPDRPIDPTHRLTGVIRADAKLAAKLKPGTSIFLIVKRAGASGPVGAPLAVDKLTWSGASVPFELTEAHAMIAGTDLSGDVIVSARYDQDSDAISKQAGDITGQLRVKVPADRLELVLDTLL